MSDTTTRRGGFPRVSRWPFKYHYSSPTAVLWALRAKLTPEERTQNGKTEYHVACPFCAKPVKSRQNHFSFSEKGYFCQVCREGGGLYELADAVELGDVTDDSPAVRQAMAMPRLAAPPQGDDWVPDWQIRPAAYLKAFTTHHLRYTLWDAYKPVSMVSISKWKLGVGQVPQSGGACRHIRLIYPAFAGGKIVAFRGRQILPECIEAGCAKWISAAKSSVTLCNLDAVQEGSLVVLSENWVDGIMQMEMDADIVACAPTAGAGAWGAEWTARIAQAKPKLVYIVYDNDAAGAPRLDIWDRHVRAWTAHYVELHGRQPDPENPRERPTQPGGWRVRDALRAAGVPVVCHRWGPRDPEKADLGTILERDRLSWRRIGWAKKEEK